MEVRTLELSILSAQGLKKVSTFGHDTCYAVAYIYSSEKKSTAVDRDGGESPCWNEKISLDCEDSLLRQGQSYVTVEIYSYGSFSNKIVGTAMISLMDVAKEEVGKPQFMAYEVRRPSGKVRGILNVSLKVGEKRTLNQMTSSTDRKKKRQDVTSLTGYPSLQEYPPSRGSSQGVTATPYPPSNPRGDSRATSISNSKKEEEPVLAYPATGVPVVYPHSQYGQGYRPQGYYYPYEQPYSYQQQYVYSKPNKYHGSSSSSSSSSGLGLLGGVLGGLLLGDVIGSIF